MLKMKEYIKKSHKFAESSPDSATHRISKKLQSKCAEVSCDGFAGFQARSEEIRLMSLLTSNARRIPQRRARDKRAGFTMLEVVFVILITGIVSVAGGKAIVQILQNYTLQKEFGKLEMESASTIRQIGKLLQNSVWDSIAINASNSFISIPNINNAEQGTIGTTNGGTKRLYFIERNANATSGYFNTRQNLNVPYFSGFIDVNLSSGKTIVSQSGTDNLANLGINNKMAIYFPFVNVGTKAYVGDKYYSNNTTNNTAIFPIKAFHQNYTYINTAGQATNTGRDSIELHSQPAQIGDVAMIVNLHPTIINLENGTNTAYEKGDLTITYGVQATQTTLLAKRVSNLHIWTENSSSLIRIRLCMEPSIIKSVMDEFCKEGIIMQ